jgi:tetratricopeptide (TPR) repeat protein
MKTTSFQLKQTTGSVREPAAWFIAGAEVATWLEEIKRWEVAQEKLRLFIVPRSAANRSAAGVLVIPSSGKLPKTSARALAYGVLAGKLYLPVDAELWPPAEPTELKFLHDVQVFHPGVGLVGFAAAEALRISDLLRLPPSRVENWNFARPGVDLNSRLRSVAVSSPVSLEELFGDVSKEIGSDPIVDLPAAPNEPGEGSVSKLERALDQMFSRVLGSFLNRLPKTGNRRNLFNKLQDWASGRLHKLSEINESLRHKELKRLLHQLESDPELGLRHAIPLNGQGDHRGIAPPSNRLGQRIPDFNLSNLRGGQGADFWNIPEYLRQQLNTRYRELANRELQLGRYRRAAYIFAQLLNDLEAAVSALKQGRHFREAAVIYRDHLRRPREAAACLAEGRLFAEAIEIYEQELLFREVGDLYMRLGQPESAAASYRQEVEKLLKRDDRITAAMMLEEQLGAPEEALAILRGGWPHSAQALKCLEAEFVFLARHGRHADGVTLLDKLRAERTSPNIIPQLTGLLSSQSSKYPDSQVRRSAADLARVKASERLPVAAPAELVQLTDALVKLAPEDKLLARDAVRFVAHRNEQFRRRPEMPRKIFFNAPVLVRTFELPKGIRWHTIKSSGPNFFAVGYASNELVLLRGDWEGRTQKLSWACPALSEAPMILEFDDSVAQPPSIILTPGPARPVLRLPEQAFHATDPFNWALPVGTPDWLPDDLILARWHNNFAWLLRSDSGNLILESRRLDGAVVSNLALFNGLAAITTQSRNFALLVQRNLIWLATDTKLFLQRPEKPAQSWEVESEILSLIGSAPHLPLCALARLQRGVAIQHFDAIKDNVETICPELLDPLATFTANGFLVLLSSREGRICDIQRAGTQQYFFDWHQGEPLALVRAGAAGEFAVFTEGGQVHLLRIQKHLGA